MFDRIEQGSHLGPRLPYMRIFNYEFNLFTCYKTLPIF